MAKPFYIQLNNPCHENWNNMAPNEQGAYCSSCRKNVIDFTRKTENEIYEILENSEGEMCGRFTQFQLQQPVRKTELNNGFLNWRAIAASLAAMLAFEKSADAGDVNDKPKIECAKTQPVAPNTVEVTITAPRAEAKLNVSYVGMYTQFKPIDTLKIDTNALQGKVVDSLTGDAIDFATLNLKGTGIGTTTELDGTFSWNLDPALHAKDVVVVSFIGYGPKEITVAELKQNGRVALNPYDRMALTAVGGFIGVRVDKLSEEQGGYLDLDELIARGRERRAERKLNKKK
jgi:hypothetical protein